MLLIIHKYSSRIFSNLKTLLIFSIFCNEAHAETLEAMAQTVRFFQLILVSGALSLVLGTIHFAAHSDKRKQCMPGVIFILFASTILICRTWYPIFPDNLFINIFEIKNVEIKLLTLGWQMAFLIAIFGPLTLASFVLLKRGKFIFFLLPFFLFSWCFPIYAFERINDINRNISDLFE